MRNTNGSKWEPDGSQDKQFKEKLEKPKVNIWKKV